MLLGKQERQEQNQLARQTLFRLRGDDDVELMSSRRWLRRVLGFPIIG